MDMTVPNLEIQEPIYVTQPALPPLADYLILFTRAKRCRPNCTSPHSICPAEIAT